MKILLDENISLRLARILRESGFIVSSIAENADKGMLDEEVWPLACSAPYLLITRDYHFTNPVRYDPSKCLGIIFLRHGNLTASDETQIVLSFLAKFSLEQYQGKLVVLSKNDVKFRSSSQSMSDEG
ncbi:MAG: DUF5615 family PIN-like protein [Candidatus Sumerlaeota bacterium]|nr:DUF5615 family PIN-like protein [Candidatus Sumerlaeota bacterium]